jgi:hypothetical protein
MPTSERWILPITYAEFTIAHRQIRNSTGYQILLHTLPISFFRPFVVWDPQGEEEKIQDYTSKVS